MDKKITIYEWMWQTGLKGNDLLLYAIIYEYEYLFSTQANVARLLGVSTPTAVKSINKLLDLNLIEVVHAKNKYAYQLAYHAIEKETINKKYE